MGTTSANTVLLALQIMIIIENQSTCVSDLLCPSRGEMLKSQSLSRLLILMLLILNKKKKRIPWPKMIVHLLEIINNLMIVIFEIKCSL